jgi:hypothetical protein
VMSVDAAARRRSGAGQPAYGRQTGQLTIRWEERADIAARRSLVVCRSS